MNKKFEFDKSKFLTYDKYDKFWTDELALEFIENYIKERLVEDNKRFSVYEPSVPDIRFLEAFIQNQGIDSRSLEHQLLLEEKKKGVKFLPEKEEEFVKTFNRNYEFPDYLFPNLKIKSDAEIIAEYEEATKTKLQGEETMSELYVILDDEGIYYRDKIKPYYFFNDYPGKDKIAFTEEDFYNNEKRINRNEEIDFHVRNLAYNYMKTESLKNPKIIFNGDRAVYAIDKHFYFYRQRPWTKLIEFFEGSPDAWEYVFLYYFSYASCLYILRKLYAFCKWFWGFGGEVPFRFFWSPF